MSLTESLELVQEDISYLKGRIDALENLLMLLIATHPQAEKISEVFRAKATQIAGLEHPTVFVQAYADGISRLTYELIPQKVLEAFQQDEMLFLQTSKSRHH